MDMKNMKMDKKKEMDNCCIPSSNPDAPAYPYGLQLYLDTETLKKLGITKLPDVGTIMKIEAVADVCGVSQEASVYGENMSLRLQITDLGLSEGKEKEKE